MLYAEAGSVGSDIIYVNGISNVSLTAGTMSLFADDIMLYRPIYCTTDYSLLLQTDIDDIIMLMDQRQLA